MMGPRPPLRGNKLAGRGGRPPRGLVGQGTLPNVSSSSFNNRAPLLASTPLSSHRLATPGGGGGSGGQPRQQHSRSQSHQATPGAWNSASGGDPLETQSSGPSEAEAKKSLKKAYFHYLDAMMTKKIVDKLNSLSKKFCEAKATGAAIETEIQSLMTMKIKLLEREYWFRTMEMILDDGKLLEMFWRLHDNFVVKQLIGLDGLKGAIETKLSHLVLEYHGIACPLQELTPLQEDTVVHNVLVKLEKILTSSVYFKDGITTSDVDFVIMFGHALGEMVQQRAVFPLSDVEETVEEAVRTTSELCTVEAREQLSQTNRQNETDPLLPVTDEGSLENGCDENNELARSKTA